MLTPSCLPGASLSQTTCSHAYFAHHCDEDDEDDENENEDDGGAIANYAFFPKALQWRHLLRMETAQATMYVMLSPVDA